MPATTNPPRTVSCFSRTMAESTRIQPIVNRRKPAGLSGFSFGVDAAITVKIPQSLNFVPPSFLFPHRYKTLMTVIRKMSFTFEGIHWQDREIAGPCMSGHESGNGPEQEKFNPT